jgi:cytochrome P450
MLLVKFPTIFQLTCLSVACISGYWLYWELTTGRRRRQLARKHGCRPAKRIKTTDPILGLDFLFTMTKWNQHHTLLENVDKLLFSSGYNTVEFNFLRYITILTTEAENTKTALSLNFRSYGLPGMPKEIDMLIGGGIFTNEGHAWHQSRELLRPCFARTQIADLDMLEKHASTLIEKIPRDGSTIDLSKLFSQFTLSVAIEFLFGDIATEGNSDAEIRSNNTFAEVWDRLSSQLGGEGQNLGMMLLRYIRVSPQFKRDCRMVHGKYPAFCWQAPSVEYIDSYGIF